MAVLFVQQVHLPCASHTAKTANRTTHTQTGSVEQADVWGSGGPESQQSRSCCRLTWAGSLRLCPRNSEQA